MNKLKLFLLDMDGTLYLEDDLFEGVLEFLDYIKNIGGRYMFLTNNSSKGIDTYLKKLHALGIDANKEDFMTSTDATALKNELLIDVPMAETVLSYAKNAADCGLDGVVCSPLEAALVKEACGRDFITVTPGIRFADGDVGDQKRIMTPALARETGTEFIVVGRPITQAADAVAAYRRVCKDFLG